MKQLSDYLDVQNKKADVNESIILATAAIVGCFAWSGAYFINHISEKSPFEDLLKPFKEISRRHRDRKNNKYSKQQEELRKKIEQAKEKRDAPKEIAKLKQELALIKRGYDDDQIAGLLALQRLTSQGIAADPNNTRFKGFDSMLKLEAASMYDEYGNPRDSKEMQKEFKKYLGEDKLKDFTADCKENLITLDVVSVKEQIKKGLESTTAKDLDEFENKTKETAKQAHKELKEAEETGEEPQFLKDCKELRNPGKKEKKDNKNPAYHQKEKKPKDDDVNNKKEASSPAPQKPKDEKPKDEKPKDDKLPSNNEINKMQDKLTNDDLSKDEKKKIKKELKAAAEERGKNLAEFIPQEVKGKNGKIYQKKIGPRGGKYYRQKGKEKWVHGTPVTEGIVNYLKSRIID